MQCHLPAVPGNEAAHAAVQGGRRLENGVVEQVCETSKVFKHLGPVVAAVKEHLVQVLAQGRARIMLWMALVVSQDADKNVQTLPEAGEREVQRVNKPAPTDGGGQVDVYRQPAQGGLGGGWSAGAVPQMGDVVYHRGIVERARDAVAINADVVVGGSPTREQPESHAHSVTRLVIDLYSVLGSSASLATQQPRRERERDRGYI